MDTFIITPQSKSESDLLNQILKRMNFKTKIIRESEKEDFAFGSMIDAGMKTESVSKDAVMKALKR